MNKVKEPTALVFENLGELDPRAWSVMGLSAKETNNPIGEYGTGLKYAIAILLRTGHRITIMSGKNSYSFTSETSTFRGKEYEQVYCNGERLPFTTELGRKWELWQAYRELYSNALDESGVVRTVRQDSIRPEKNTTKIIVIGENIEAIHEHRDSFFIGHNHTLLAESSKVQIYQGSGIYLKGVKVSRPDLFTRYAYNFHNGGISISEDRMCDSGFGLWIKLIYALDTINNPTILETCMLKTEFGEKETIEDHLDWDYANSPTTCKVLESLFKNKPEKMTKSAYASYKARKPQDHFTEYTPTKEELAKLESAINSLATCYPVTLPIKLIKLDDPSVLGVHADNTAYITQAGLQASLKKLTSVVFEEAVFHGQLNHADLSRQGQTWLIDQLLTHAIKA